MIASPGLGFMIDRIRRINRIFSDLFILSQKPLLSLMRETCVNAMSPCIHPEAYNLL
jgi:hypothetical protein